MTPAEANELVKWLMTDALARARTEVSITGELLDIKDLRERGGMVYFSLQEGKDRFRCQVSAELANELGKYLTTGTVCECHGSLVVGRPGSTPRVELAVKSIEVIEGELSPRAKLLDELQARGWLSQKHQLPALPQRIGLVTSPESEAVMDFLTIVEEFDLEVEVVEVSLASEQSIIEGLRQADGDEYDVIVLTRGGGEGLGVFDGRAIAETIHRMKTPVISAVGHERDWTIADHIADARASTPTAAAKLVSAGHQRATTQEEVIEEISARTAMWRTIAIALGLLLALLLWILYMNR